MSWVPPSYNDANFRQQFPAFANQTQYPAAALQFAWDMGANWISQEQPAIWGMSGGLASTGTTKIQQAADLMGAVIVAQLYGPAANGQQTASSSGATSGPLSSASQGSVSASFTLPQFGTSTFRSWLLSAPPYGTMLLALLEQAASVGPYIASGRPSWIPP